MRKLDQAEREIERKCIDLSMRFRDAAKEDRAAVQKELAESVNKHFDLRQQRRELQLKRLEEELQRLRDAIKRREEAREQIVKKRVGELLGEGDDMRF
jgi:chromosome segregation ATPase